MKAKFLFYVLMLATSAGWSQEANGNDGIPFPNESILIHLNRTTFISGETLLFKVYCLNAESGKLSDLSSIAYLELVSKDGNPLMQMKLKLDNGKGNGDYFFSGNIPSGNYTLIAYTKWMRNFNTSKFFRCNIKLINPAMIPAISKTTLASSLNVNESVKMTSEGITLGLNKSEYGTREKVTLSIACNETLSANLSVNVTSVEKNSEQISWNISTPEESLSEPVKFLPDFRGELISGKVTEKITSAPKPGRVVSLSSPAKDFEFLTATTDSKGRYYFSTSGIKSNYVLFKIHGDYSQDLTISNDDSFIVDHEPFLPLALSVDSTMLQMISTRDLSQQVENAFYSVKEDSVISAHDGRSFFVPDKIYDLDDFTRFPTMEDVLREIIGEVVIKLRGKNFSIVVKNVVTGFNFANSPLVLVDGVPVADANVLMKYNPALVKRVSLGLRHYYYGGLETDGIVSITTYDGDAKNLPIADMLQEVYTPTAPSKIYYSPDYSGTNDLSRIPDFRSQLYWAPSVEIKATGKETITFFTGDLSGTFLAEVAGITSSGKKIYWQQTFVIK